jgi:hypothetical protein
VPLAPSNDEDATSLGIEKCSLCRFALSRSLSWAANSDDSGESFYYKRRVEDAKFMREPPAFSEVLSFRLI